MLWNSSFDNQWYLAVGLAMKRSASFGVSAVIHSHRKARSWSSCCNFLTSLTLKPQQERTCSCFGAPSQTVATGLNKFRSIVPLGLHNTFMNDSCEFLVCNSTTGRSSANNDLVITGSCCVVRNCSFCDNRSTFEAQPP